MTDNDDSESLKQVYRRVGNFVDEIVESLSEDDDLLPLSDHGISVTFLDSDQDNDPNSHLWRAYASTTTDQIPEDVDVREWIESHLLEPSAETNDVEMPVEQLRELGYID